MANPKRDEEEREEIDQLQKRSLAQLKANTMATTYCRPPLVSSRSPSPREQGSLAHR